MYCIKYYPVPPDNTERELEWGRFPGQWSIAYREAGDSEWDFSEGLDGDSYKALLEHFCLWNWRHEFPAYQAVGMGPDRLTAERRKKEQELNLPYCAIITHD